MEITLPTESEMISVAKYSAYKPTIFISGRQHANEVSSTNHIFKLGELLVTETSYREILKRVNVILHPMTNPRRADGLRPAEADADAHAARRPLQRAGPGRREQRHAAARVAGARQGLARVAAGHLPEPARISVARVGAAVRRLCAAGVPIVLVDTRLVYEPVGGARSTAAGSHRGDRGAARGYREADQRQCGRPRDEPAQPGALPQVGVRLQPERLRARDLQGHRDLLHPPGNRRC